MRSSGRAILYFLPIFALALCHPANGEGDVEKLKKLHEQAWTLYLDGHRAEARSKIGEALAIDPKPGDSFLVLSAMIHTDELNCPEALHDIEDVTDAFDEEFVKFSKADPKLLKDNPGYINLRRLYSYVVMVQGTCNHALGNMEESRRYLLLLKREWPALFGVEEAAELADAFVMGGEYAQAQGFYQQAHDWALKKYGRSSDENVRAKMLMEYERARYNLVITNFVLEKYDRSYWILKQLLTETPRREYWLKKMANDKDYQPILAKEHIQEWLEELKPSD